MSCSGIYTQVLFCKLTEYQQELYEDYVTGPDVAAMLVGRKKVGLPLPQPFSLSSSH